MKTLIRLGLFCGLLLCGCVFAEDVAPGLDATERQSQRWRRFMLENEIDRLWMELSAKVDPRSLAVKRVSLIAMTDDRVRPDHTVLVRDGRIAAVGPSAEIAVPDDAVVVDGRGKYLIPGLVDMHVHNLVSNGQHLLELANGVTSVRDMSGFTWMLILRERIARSELLAPNLYLAGHILNARPMGFYATVVASSEAARRAVRDQGALGYDFIKVHNVLPRDVYHAVLDEARRLEMDVVGHVPHDVTVTDAIAAGQRTIEHFKGYILDRTLQISDADFVTATDGAEVWNCPTFYTYRAQLRGEEARRLILDAEEMRYAEPGDRRDWLALAATPVDRLTELRRGVLAHSRAIFRRLLEVDARFVAGTDSGGGIAMMVPGFALHEELRLMAETGLSPYETLRAATVEAARAMRREEDFGTVAAGKRADLVLLAANPLEDVANLRRIEGVAVRGAWLSAGWIENSLREIAEIYRVDDLEGPIAPPTRAEVEALLGRMREMRDRGFVFRDFDLEELARLLLAAGLEEEDRRLLLLRAR